MNPEALAAALVTESGERWGDVALPWQVEDARAVLSGRRPRWHYWLRARGMSKTSDAAVVALVLMIEAAPPRSRSYVYAVDAGQATLLLDALGGLAERSGLLGLVEIGSRTVTVKNGATLTVEASDGASAFGTRPWLVIVDELGLWPDTPNHERLWTSIISGLGKVRGSRLLVLTSAGSPSSPAHKRWQAALAGSHWRASLTPGPSPWWSADDVEAARQDLTPAEFRRYVLCEWVEGDQALATAEDVAACVGAHRVLEPVAGSRYTLGLDVGLRRDSTVLTVGHLETTPAGRKTVIDRVMRWTGTREAPVSLGDVETAILAVWRAYGRPKLVFDPYQAAQLSERLQTAMVRTEEFVFSTSGVNRLARSLYGALRDRAIVLPDDDELLTELASVRLVEVGPGLVRLDHRPGGHDDQAVACALVLCELTDLAPSGGRPFLWPDDEIRYEAMLQAAGEPHREVMAGGIMAGSGVALHPEDVDPDNPPGQTRRSAYT